MFARTSSAKCWVAFVRVLLFFFFFPRKKVLPTSSQSKPYTKTKIVSSRRRGRYVDQIREYFSLELQCFGLLFEKQGAGTVPNESTFPSQPPSLKKFDIVTSLFFFNLESRESLLTPWKEALTSKHTHLLGTMQGVLDREVSNTDTQRQHTTAINQMVQKCKNRIVFKCWFKWSV